MKKIKFDGKLLKKWRKTRNMSRAELGVKLYELGTAVNPVSRQAIQQFEACETSPRGATLAGLCVIFQVPATVWYGIGEREKGGAK